MMIDLSDVIHSPEFERDITIERTTGGHLVGTEYVGDKTLLTVRGVLVNPKNGKEIQQTEQGDRVSGAVNVYTDAGTPLYTTRETLTKEHNISDIIIDTEGTRYRITGVSNQTQWGFYKAEAQKEGAL